MGLHVLGNGPHVLGNWPHVLGNGPHVLGNGPYLCTQFMNTGLFLLWGGKAVMFVLSWPLLG